MLKACKTDNIQRDKLLASMCTDFARYILCEVRWDSAAWLTRRARHTQSGLHDESEPRGACVTPRGLEWGFRVATTSAHSEKRNGQSSNDIFFNFA